MKDKKIITEEDINLIRNSKQEITAGEALTHENLQKFINSGLAGATVADLVKYFESLIAKKMEEVLNDFSEFCHEHYQGSITEKEHFVDVTSYLYDNEIVWLAKQYIESKYKQ